MIRNFKIANFKSIVSANIPIGRFTVLIGENGAGKSNILEALVMASAASKGNLEREVLIGRGVRVPKPDLLGAAFSAVKKLQTIEFAIGYETLAPVLNEVVFRLKHSGIPYDNWEKVAPKTKNNVYATNLEATLRLLLNSLSPGQQKAELKRIRNYMGNGAAILTGRANLPDAILELVGSVVEQKNIENFTLYSPDYYTLRNFVAEGQTAPLGTRGEGLLQLLTVMQRNEPKRLAAVNDGLEILGWFKALDLKALAQNASENRLQVKDRFIKRRGVVLDQLSTNEGFLFCLFYLVLFASSNTPDAFAIENIENGLNPKLCEALVQKLKILGERYGKQVIVSTHSPSVLDALNLDNPEEKLIAVDRNVDGHTRINVIKKPRQVGGKTTRLSELFLQGHLGGLPRNFV